MFLPTEDRVILKPVPPETETKSKLIIPIEAQKIKMWEVVAVGPSASGLVKIQPGMLVMIPPEAGVDYEDDGQQFRCIRHSVIELYSEKA